MTPLQKQIVPAFDAETQEFYDGIIDMFTGLRAGHMGRYCFSGARSPHDPVRGDEHWTQFIKTSSAYYPYRDQVAIIQQSAAVIGDLVSDAPTWIDLGTGSLNSFERKVLPIICAAKVEDIVFVDLCASFSKLAAARLQQEKLAIQSSAFLGNFFEVLPHPATKAVINLFGITLGNIIVDLPRETPEQVLTKTMRHFAAALAPQGGYFVFDYDTNEDEPSIHKSYDHPSYRAMEMTVLERVKRDLPTQNFDPCRFEHVTVWYPEHKLLAQELRSICDQHFVIGDKQFQLSKGQAFRTGSSFKYSDATIDCAAREAGFLSGHLFTLPGSPMRVAVYEVEK